MCECLADAVTCACCGSQVSYQMVEDESVLMHFVEHEIDDEGDEVSVWQPHEYESCMEARREHWRLLVRAGVAVESV